MENLDVGDTRAWLVLGVFNEIMKSRDKWGGNP